ncbi:ubiquinone/menaquinone biosynthesis C-methylase UbiE [Methanomicrobium sp. W14]|uniref:class I SAM-dependent methyltransferase n=1 Tax=Methanomicrobium sp. W14 TaxID=2817839 RepID=UPI001AE7066E|nr:class I SAM-dependent methyltransferase [Methanomicrobium sp. W14]MBP2134179.1 ubiquinone/menaquinone biosynthesis C-methylase UbiE [Methanomicrobium sp. W14]
MRYYVMPFLYRTTTGAHRKTLEKMLCGFRDLDVLDIACGTGICERILDSSDKCTGLDISDEMLHKSSFLSEHRKIHFNPVKGDAVKLPFKDEAFDVVLCSLALHFMPDFRVSIREASRVLKKEGSFVCCCPVMQSGIILDSYWRYYYSKGRFYAPIFEKDLKETCVSCGLSYRRISKNGKLLYFTCENK